MTLQSSRKSRSTRLHSCGFWVQSLRKRWVFVASGDVDDIPLPADPESVVSELQAAARGSLWCSLFQHQFACCPMHWLLCMFRTSRCSPFLDLQVTSMLFGCFRNRVVRVRHRQLAVTCLRPSAALAWIVPSESLSIWPSFVAIPCFYLYLIIFNCSLLWKQHYWNKSFLNKFSYILTYFI